MVYFEAPHLTLVWDEKLQGVYETWRGFVTSEVFRSGAARTLELQAQKKSSNWLSDLKDLRVLSLADQEWLAKEWLPKCVGYGVRKVAIVMPTNIISQMSVKRVASQIDGKSVETGYFDDVEEARQWLQSFSLIGK